MIAPGYRRTLRERRLRQEGAEKVIALVVQMPDYFAEGRYWLEQDDRPTSGCLYVTARGTFSDREDARHGASRLEERARQMRLPVPFRVFFLRRGLIAPARAARTLLDVAAANRGAVLSWVAWLEAHAELLRAWEPVDVW